MSIFKKINNELTDNVTVTPKQKKSPLPRFQKNKSGKILYIIVRDPELINSSGNATHITLIKLPITAPSSPRSIKHLIAKYGTEEAKSGKYEITEHNFDEIMSHFRPANELYKKYRKEELHEKQSVVINSKEEQVCKIAALIHQASDAFDELEGEDEIDVLEAQEIHQALYRVKNRLRAARMPDTYYNEFLFKEDDKESVEHMRSKRKFNLEDKASLMRFVKVFSKLTPLMLRDRDSSKTDIKAVALRRKIEELKQKVE
ncbi:hypothetical protein ACKVMY_03510 [Vibrio natriegens]|uniref:hypothetical protein n=1 Tax=Vibrio natriegens TaxID=691 RepID=UPI003DA019A3